MAWFSKRKRAGITNPVSGQLQVVACSPFPDAVGELVLHPKCDIDGVITAERLVPTVVQYSAYAVPKIKWPRPGMVLPVTLDIADPTQFRIEWHQVPTGKAADHAFPRVWREGFWREGEHAASAPTPTLVNGLTPRQTELALSGRAADVGLVPTIATVLAAHEVEPSSAPGGTWDIIVRVIDPAAGQGWEAVTRISFSSPHRREMRTASGVVLPVLVDPDRRNRIIVDVARLS